MQLTVNFVGAEPNEQTPSMALYTIDARGQATKVSALSNGKVDLGADPSKLGATVALGPDVADPKTLDPKTLVTLNVAAQLPTWQKTGVLEVAPNFWRPWLPIRVCVSGKVTKCFPFITNRVPLLRSIATGIRPPLEICWPVCNGVVEVWESSCCCFPFLLTDVPNLIAKLKGFLAANPVMFPTPPRPDPIGPIATLAATRAITPVAAPMDRVLAKSVDSAIAAGQIDYRFVPNTEISQDLTTLQSLQPADAVQYFQLHPSLWPIWCSCTTSKLGETTLNPDGSFSYCYTKFLLPILTCFKSYFYKVKQFQNGAWVYIYDGSAAHQYFNADQVANLSTFLGAACGTTTPPPPGTDFVTLQQIGGTQSGNLHSNYLGASAANIDLTQTGPYSVATPPADGGLVNANDAPWCNTLSFMLAFDPGMEALGAYYYRFSYAPADLNGNPIGAMRVVPPGATVPPAIGWSKFVSAVVGGNSVIEIEGQTLGPNTVGGVSGLYQIPYNGNVQPSGGTGSNQDWLGGQFHYSIDTTQLDLVPAGGGAPAPGCGRFLLAVEIFNQAGHRMIPSTVPVAAGSGDVASPFKFLRWMPVPPSGPQLSASVQQPALTHLFWADNRPVVAEIDNFTLNGVTSSEECQYLSGPPTADLQVGYRAYHAVLSDPNPPHPPTTFMSSFAMSWERGLNGGSGTLVTGGATDEPATRAAGSPAQTPAANGALSTLLPAGGPSACSFAITLDVYSKATDGTGAPSGLDRSTVAALSLSVS